jgi:hypothetical protein
VTSPFLGMASLRPHLILPQPSQSLAGCWADWGGEIWFKLDSATQGGTLRTNGIRLSRGERRSRLLRAIELAPTWLQTCIFRVDGIPSPEAEQIAYLRFLHELGSEGVRLAGVLLYTLARPPARPDGARRLRPVSASWLEDFAARIRATGLAVLVSPGDPSFVPEPGAPDGGARDPEAGA